MHALRRISLVVAPCSPDKRSNGGCGAENELRGVAMAASHNSQHVINLVLIARSFEIGRAHV